MDAGQAKKKPLKIISNVLLYVFIALCVFSVVMTSIAKSKGDGAVTIFGRQMRYVLSPSMEKSEFTNTDDYDIKEIPVKSMIFIKTVPKDPDEAYAWYDALEIGDVLTFRYVYTTQETITHRIIYIEEKKDETGFIIILEGDNKSSEEGALQQTIDTSKVNSPNYVIGKVTGYSRFIGGIASIFQSPVGLICAVILPCVAIVIFEIFKITKVLGQEKKQKADEEKQRQQDELEALRRRLEELERAKSAEENPPPLGNEKSEPKET